MNTYEEMLRELEEQLKDIDTPKKDISIMADQGIGLVREVLDKMRERVWQEGFKSREAEIYFFKHIKPQVTSRLIYYVRLMDLDNRRPVSQDKAKRKYLAGHIEVLQRYLNGHSDFYRYYRQGSTALDHVYFLRDRADVFLSTEAIYALEDSQFSTSHDHMAATILAYEKLIVYLVHELDRLSPGAGVRQLKSKLSWTASKASLTELIYALHSGEVFNHGQADIREITSIFEKFCDIRLPHVYRAYAAIKSRKGQRARFLEELIFRFSQKMDQDDSM